MVEPTLDKGRTNRADSPVYVGVVPPGDPERLRARVVLALRDEARQPGPDDVWYSNEGDRAALAALRGRVLEAYELANPRHHEQQQRTLVAFLVSGRASEASRRAGVDDRIGRRWVSEFLEFACDYLEAETKRRRAAELECETVESAQHRAERDRVRRNLIEDLQGMCSQICGRESKGGGGGEGQGCPTCPRRWIPR